MNSLRKHLSYANVVATLALVFAMGGSAVAAKHYLINSTSQINPKVLKRLRGTSGTPGSTGAQGLAGAIGANGGQGPTGADGKQGPEGETGEQGPSAAWHAEGTPPLTVSVPAGEYVVTSKASEFGGTGNSFCQLKTGAETIDISFGQVVKAPGIETITIANLGTASLAAPETITLECAGPGTSTFGFAQLTATQVGAIH